MRSFNDFKSVDQLKKLAENPFDLTQVGGITPERLNHFCREECGYKLLYGTEKVTDEVMDALKTLADEAGVHQKMKKMQEGSVVNYVDGHPSENRPALHTALRDFFDEPQKTDEAIKASKLALAQVEKLKKFLSTLSNKFTEMIVVGIGGSDLGPRANYLALRHLRRNGNTVHFISNVDPDDGALVLTDLNLSKTLVVVISKSGTTLETCTNEALLRDRFSWSGLNPKDHFIAITGKDSPMDDQAKYLECFYIWDWVGGRYSASSMVGGMPMAFAYGFDVYWEFLQGAHAMDKCALQEDNLPLLGALLTIWNHNFLGYETLAIIPYSQALERYPAHIQQVSMESNGKSIDQHGLQVNYKTGPIIWGESGTNAQHSFFQLIHQGTSVIPVEFIGFKENQSREDFHYQGTTSQEKLLANLFAQTLALATGKTDKNPNKIFTGNRPSHILLGKQLTPYALGSLFSFYEHKTAFEGFIWGINSFDQEGVQLGKVLSTKIIECFANKSESTYPLGEAFLKQLETL